MRQWQKKNASCRDFNASYYEGNAWKSVFDIQIRRKKHHHPVDQKLEHHAKKGQVIGGNSSKNKDDWHKQTSFVSIKIKVLHQFRTMQN